MIKNQIDVITLGCSKNLVDSEKLMKLLEESGYTLSHNPAKVNGEIQPCINHPSVYYPGFTPVRGKEVYYEA